MEISARQAVAAFAAVASRGLKGTENKSVSEALQSVPPDAAVPDPNQLPVCVEIMRPSINPNSRRRLSRKTLAICPAPLVWLTDELQALSSCWELANNWCT